MQGILELDIVSRSGSGHGTPDFGAPSETLSAITEENLKAL